jgi:hypothetical protein
MDYAAVDKPASAVSWGAIFAGAAAAAVFSLILLVLGTGLGLASLSPWTQAGASAATLGVSAIIWITVTQIMASGVGGYLAGRLRTRWLSVHSDEVYFRDTAHGFLAWAIASLSMAALLASSVGSIVNGAAQAGATVAAGAAAVGAGGAAAVADKMKPGSASGASGGAAGGDDSMRYFVDSLFRKDAAAANAAPATTTTASPAAPSGAEGSMASRGSDQAPTAEVTRIIVQSGTNAALPAEDLRYLGQLVAQRTGLSQQDAEKRVTDTVARMQAKVRDAEAQAKEAADKARKATAYSTLWLFVSLLIGAFVASISATWGGRERDA